MNIALAVVLIVWTLTGLASFFALLGLETPVKVRFQFKRWRHWLPVVRLTIVLFVVHLALGPFGFYVFGEVVRRK